MFSIKRVAFFTALSVCIAIGITSCSHYDQIKKNERSSKNGDSESHNQGENCMQCHKKGGEAGRFINDKLWSIGGTIYDGSGNVPSPNGLVLLYTKPGGQGELKYSFEIDQLGNVYTNQIIDFSVGLYPWVISSTGGSAGMGSPLPDGRCNNCHGVSTSRISVN